MESGTRKRCGHCNQYLSSKVFKQHKSTYYSEATLIWTRDVEFSSDDESPSATGHSHLNVDDFDGECFFLYISMKSVT